MLCYCLKTPSLTNGKRETSYSYDPNGNILEEINPLGQVTKRTYDSLNRLTSESDTAGQLSLYQYDHDNRVTKVTNDEGATASLNYDGNGNLTSVFSGSQRVTSYAYDLEDQLLTATQGTGDKASRSSYTYDSVGNITSVTNGNGKTTTYTYDQLSNLVEKMTALGDKETYTYDLNNRLEIVTKADGKTISYDYNKLDQLLTVNYSEKQDGQVLYTYDADGRRVSMSDLTGTTRYAYNDEGELVGLRQGDGSLIEYTYDDFGNISQMTYPDGSTVSYTYDELDRLVSVTDARGQKTTYSYNNAGDMTEVERGDGTKSFLAYDRAHRVTEIRHVDKKNKLISSYAYEYDDGNYITKETITQNGETLVQAYTYDTLGQIETMTVSDKAGKELSTLTYTYDQAGNKLTSTEVADGKEIKTSYTYDDNNRLIKLDNKDGVTTYSYDKNGNRISQGEGDKKLNYIYDTENRLLAVKDKDGLLMAALYDGDGNRVFTASRKEGKNTYQLFSRKPNDKSGKKSPYTAPGGDEPSLFWYGFSQNVLQALSSLPQTVGSIWHDIFEDVSTAYHQKIAKDRATEEGLVVNPPDLGDLPGEGQVTYTSEVADVLIPYTTREDSYHYYEVRNYVNDVNREHAQVLQTYDQDLQARETYTYGNGRASYLNNLTDDSYNYFTNVSGSVVGLSQNGQAVASSSYQLYGASKQTTDTTGNPYAYNGEARDSTGLDYLRARYYDSQAGTFLTADSYPGQLTAPLTQNGYAYVSNNPVNYTDPSGHFLKGLMKKASSLVNKAGQVLTNIGRSIANVATSAYNAGRKVISTIVTGGNNRGSSPSSVSRSHSPYSGGSVGNSGPSHTYVQHQQTQARSQVDQGRRQHILNEYAQATGQKTMPKTREGINFFRNMGKSLIEMYTHVCNTPNYISKATVNFVKNVDWKKVAVTAGAIGVGMALTIATGGLGAPVAMAIGGAASGALISGYDSYTSGQRGWTLAGSVVKGAGLGAVTGFVAGGLSTVGIAGNFASKATQNITNHTVRQVASAGIEASVETVIDTGIDLATGNRITGQTVAMNFAYNLVSNGAGSLSTKKGAKAEVATTKSGAKKSNVQVEFTDGNGNKGYGGLLASDYKHNRPVKDVTPSSNSSQKLLDGPRADTKRLEAPKTSGKADFYVAPDGRALPATGYRYMDSRYAEQTMHSMEAPGGYIGFSRFDSAKQVQNAYQISPDWSDARLRGEFDTLQIMDDNVRVPRALGDKEGEMFEPITKAYPEFGSGGYAQLITDKLKSIKFRDVTMIGD